MSWSDGRPPRPQGWGTSKRDRRRLQLTEISILRRRARGESSAAIARALGIGADSVRMARKRMRDAFGVDTDAELLAHPDVRDQI